MSIANYFETLLLKALRNESPAKENVYAKLHTGDPGEEGTANAAGEATRKQLTFAAPSGGSIATSADVEWAGVSTSETITHLSLWDANAAGNCLWTLELGTSKAVSAGDTFKIKSGDLTLSLD